MITYLFKQRFGVSFISCQKLFLGLHRHISLSIPLFKLSLYIQTLVAWASTSHANAPPVLPSPPLPSTSFDPSSFEFKSLWGGSESGSWWAKREMGRSPCCEKVGLKKGRWTAEEDDILTNYIKANGEGSWRSLPKNAGLIKWWLHNGVLDIYSC